MLSKNKLDSLNIQEIDNLQAESISGGNFRYGRNGRSGTQVDGNSVTINSYRAGDQLDLVNTNPGANNANDTGHNFTVEFFGGAQRNNLLRTDSLQFGQAAGVAPRGTARIVITQAEESLQSSLTNATRDIACPPEPSNAERVSIQLLCGLGPS